MGQRKNKKEGCWKYSTSMWSLLAACLLVQCRDIRVLASELFATQKWALRLWLVLRPEVLDKGTFIFFAAWEVFIVGQGGVIFQVEGGAVRSPDLNDSLRRLGVPLLSFLLQSVPLPPLPNCCCFY